MGKRGVAAVPIAPLRDVCIKIFQVKEQGMDQTQQALNPAVDLAGILLSE
jgi:hypothetical protein